MVKTIHLCQICHKIASNFSCRYCHHEFCRECIMKTNPTGFCDQTVNSGNARDDQNNQRLTNYCAFNCLRSFGTNYCFDCGGSFVGMNSCLCCNTVFCSLCHKKNLLEKKKLTQDKMADASLFCSQTCYEIFVEQPNNSWNICEDCGAEYFDVSYKKCCLKCLKKHQFHQNNIYNIKRDALKIKIRRHMRDQGYSIKDLERKIKIIVAQKQIVYHSESKNNVNLSLWLYTLAVGDNLSFNLWDEAVEDYLIKIDL